MAVEVVNNPNSFDCQSCVRRHCDEDGLMEGSIGKAPYDLFEIKGVIRSNVCLLPMIKEASFDAIRLYEHYKSGYLPYDGGILDQPGIYIDAIDIIAKHSKRNPQT